MRCLTHSESKAWFEGMGVQIEETGNLSLRPVPPHIMTTMPQRANNQVFFSARLIDWLVCDSDRMLWISDWQTFPSQLIPFTKIRVGCGESRPLVEAPGHLFETPIEEENAIISGLVFLIMAFNWSAYIIAANSKDYIYIGDEYLVFSSSAEDKLKEARNLSNEYELKVIQNNREAWT